MKNKIISEYMASLGRKKSERKTKANRENIKKRWEKYRQEKEGK